MAASTTSREASRKDGDVVAYPVQAGVVINKGTFVFLDSTGYARPGRAGVAGDIFIGVAYEAVNNALGVAGALTLRVFKTGSFIFPKGAATAQTDLGAAMYAADDQTLTATATGNVLVGYVCAVVDAINLRLRIGRGVQ